MRNRLFLLLIILLTFPTVMLSAQEQITQSGLLHNSRNDLYRIPYGAVPFGTEITLRLRTMKGEADSVSLRLLDTVSGSQSLVPMEVVATTPEGYQFWEANFTAPEETGVWNYRFVVKQGDRTLYYEDDTVSSTGGYVAANKGGVGTMLEVSNDASYQISVYDPTFYTPEWMRNGIIYQIFPDRFRDGDESNNPADGSDTFYGNLDLIFNEVWNAPPVDGRVTTTEDGTGYFNSDFFGGDLAGVTEKLDYLQSLGVTAIYLNPIFEARSNHRYDTADYKTIDSRLGTMEDFRQLVEEAQKRGIVLILDGVFNHLSSDSVYFDRYNRFETDGACESAESEWRSWFYFTPPANNQPSACVDDGAGNRYYVSWFGFDSIPKIDNSKFGPRAFFVRGEDSVAHFWGREGIGGWRLDVAGDIDNGRDPRNSYWENFRKVVRDENPEAVIIGEEWNDASQWLLGDEWDSTMNYRFRRGILGFVRDTDYGDNDGLIPALTASQFEGTVRSVEEDYPPMAYHAQMNVLGSHDTSRLFFTLENDVDALKLAALTQFTLPGAPTVYYGDEIALDAPNNADGQDDPYNRAPYPWADEDGNHYPAPNEDVLNYYQTLGQMRANNPALREGEMMTLDVNDDRGTVAFLRRDKSSGNAALVILNSGTQEIDLALVSPMVFGGLLPSGLTLEPVFGDTVISTDDSQPNIISIPANSGNVWTVTVENPSVFDGPGAPSGLTAENAEEGVRLSWEAVEGAAGYHVYRSPVAMGGFERITDNPVNETVVTDATITRGFVYHYAIAAVSETGMTGDLSASIQAVPAYEITDAQLIGDYEQTVTLQYGLTVEVEAAVTVSDVTGGDQAVPGLVAEARLVSDDESAWQPMTFVRGENGADVYSAQLMPKAPGIYTVQVRFSGDAGNTATELAAEGVMVEASNDVEAPPAPDAINVASASLGGVTLAWEAVEADDLAVYRIYRSSGPDSEFLLAEVGSDETSYTDTNVTEGATYTYRLTVVDTILNESESAATRPVAVAQTALPVRFIANVPEGTNSPVYIAGDFKSAQYPTWDPGAGNMRMEDIGNNQWAIILNFAEGTKIEYKFARGTWDAVEKGTECEEISNRTLTIAVDSLGEPGADGVYEVQHDIAKWRDLDSCG